MSETPEGAGGVGGLVVEWCYRVSGGTTSLEGYAPCYDGNGNVMALVSLSLGEVVGQYEYGAFGETISVEGDWAVQGNPVRFSTKYWDAETGLSYYGFRYYQPKIGHWLSRDPIGIKGGLNLYGMVGNDGINHTDYLGLSTLLDAGDGSVYYPTQAEIDELKGLFKQLNEKKDGQGRKCYEASFDAQEKTINGMFDDVKQNDVTFLIAHGDTDANNAPRVQGSDGKRWSISFVEVAQTNGHRVLFYACNQDENGNRLVDPKTSKPYPASDQSLTKSQKGVVGWLRSKAKELLAVKECPCVTKVGASTGPR